LSILPRHGLLPGHHFGAIAYHLGCIVRACHRIDDLSGSTHDGNECAAGIAGGVMLVGLLDVPSLWSVAKVRDYHLDGPASARIGLVLNRFRKLPGFSEDESQSATKTRIMWKIPNQYAAASSAMDRGVPWIEQNLSELARTFTSMAHMFDEVKVK
jgi:hypothetical protein